MNSVELRVTACQSCGHEHQIALEFDSPIASQRCPTCGDLNYTSRYERMDIGLSEVCNLCCLMCRRPQVREFMSFDRILRLLAEAQRIGIRTVSFSGGEPFVHPQFRDILKASVGMGFDVELVTNGTLVRKSDIADLEQLRCVTVSVDGPRRQHDFIRGKSGCWDKTMSTLRLLRDSDVKWGTNTVIQAHNADVLYDTWRSILAVGRPSYVALTHVEVVPETAHLQPTHEQTVLAKQQVSRIKDECERYHVHFNDAAFLGEFFVIFADKTRRYRPVGGCSIPATFLGVSGHGIFPCWHQGRHIKVEGLLEALQTDLCRSIVREGLSRKCVGCNAANYSWSEGWVRGIVAAHKAGDWSEGVVYLSAEERDAGGLSKGTRTLPLLERELRKGRAAGDHKRFLG
jgi:MoaA/NifB/PqqE/SkfB family radical SAM enzyme